MWDHILLRIPCMKQSGIALATRLCFVYKTAEWISIKFIIGDCGILGSRNGEKKKFQKLSERWKDSILRYP